jgi:hypothetical protein
MADKRTASLDGLIQTKGAARPDTLVQRGEAPTPHGCSRMDCRQP